jgi:hypothetical protein
VFIEEEELSWSDVLGMLFPTDEIEVSLMTSSVISSLFQASQQAC